MLQHVHLHTDMDNEHLMQDRLRVNKLVLKVASWVASQWRGELNPGTTVSSPVKALAACATVLAFGDERLDLQLPDLD